MHTMVTFFQEKKRSLLGSVEREESSHGVIYSITFSKNLVPSLRNLKVVLDKLLQFHIQGSGFLGFFLLGFLCLFGFFFWN